ncbi:MAG: LemA family protein [Myxococcales bacterium]|nr:LemA family protein [Myxococcales bacterium]
MLKKRFDLIPGIVATVKQYARHEQDTLTQLTELRARTGTMATSERVQRENQISHALGNIMLVAENYPELRASENFQQLQRALNELEEQLSAARRAYNAAVTDYNDAVQMLPTSLVASLLKHQRMAVFTAEAAERKNPDVQAMFQS